MNKVYLVTSPELGYALFYTELSAAKIMKLKIEQELGAKAAITTFQADMTFEQVNRIYHKGEFNKIDFSNLRSAMNMKKVETWTFSSTPSDWKIK